MSANGNTDHEEHEITNPVEECRKVSRSLIFASNIDTYHTYPVYVREGLLALGVLARASDSGRKCKQQADTWDLV